MKQTKYTDIAKRYLHGMGCFSNPALQILTRAKTNAFFSPHSWGKQELQFCYIFCIFSKNSRLRQAHAKWLTICTERIVRWRSCFPFCVSLNASSDNYRKEKSNHTLQTSQNGAFPNTDQQIRCIGYPAHTPGSTLPGKPTSFNTAGTWMVAVLHLKKKKNKPV